MPAASCAGGWPVELRPLGHLLHEPTDRLPGACARNCSASDRNRALRRLLRCRRTGRRRSIGQNPNRARDEFGACAGATIRAGHGFLPRLTPGATSGCSEDLQRFVTRSRRPSWSWRAIRPYGLTSVGHTGVIPAEAGIHRGAPRHVLVESCLDARLRGHDVGETQRSTLALNGISDAPWARR